MNREQIRGLKRLKRLGEGLLLVEERNFEFAILAQNRRGCGFVGCAIGHAPDILPNWFKKKDCGYFGFEITTKTKHGLKEVTSFEAFNTTEGTPSLFSHVFGIDRNEAALLFMPGPRPQLSIGATPKQVGRNIIRFVDEKLMEDAAT